MTISTTKTRVDELQRGRRWLAFPYAVIKKFGADSSSNLAVLITYYAFFSIFPLLLALFSVLGFVLAGHPSWKRKVQTSALQHLPLIKGPVPDHGTVIIVVLGIALALYSGLGVAKAALTAWDIVYAVPQDERPGFVPKNLHALRLVLFGGLGLVATTVASSLVASSSAIGLNLGPWLSVLSLAVTLVLNTLLFCVVFRWLTVREQSFRDALPGAAVSAVGLGILQALASAFIAHKLKGATATYGSFGTVIVLLSWFYLQSQVLMFGAQINVVRQDHLWPRSLDEQLDHDLVAARLPAPTAVVAMSVYQVAEADGATPAVPDRDETTEMESAVVPVLAAAEDHWDRLAATARITERRVREGLRSVRAKGPTLRS